MTVRVEKIDQRTAPEEQIAALHKLWVQWDKDALPEDPPIPYAQFLADMRHYLSTRYSPKWLLYDGEEVAGVAAAYMDTQQNLDNAHGFVHVHPARRGHGHARRLIEVLVAELEEQRRVRLAIDLPEHFEGRGLAMAMGLKPVYRERRSRLIVAELDRDLMRAWIGRATERASDYELVFARSPIPEEMIEDFVALMHVMNTAPREDYEEEDEVFTVEEWREREKVQEARKAVILTCIARHKPSGQMAGYTNLEYQGLFPEQAWQWDTGVEPAHRNRGLGRWLKAAMIERLIEVFAEVERIDTFNAGSNEPMLNLNIEMGYKPILSEQVYQGPVSAIRSWVERGR